jgi:error-prone DNA polymerase
VVFVSLDDGTGPVSNVVFFHDAQERIGGGVFHTNYMLVRGRTRRSGAKGLSLTGENLWDLVDVAVQSKKRHAVEVAEASLAATAATAPLMAHVGPDLGVRPRIFPLRVSG